MSDGNYIAAGLKDLTGKIFRKSCIPFQINISNPIDSKDVTKASVASEFLISWPGGDWKISWDSVVAFEANWWPSIAEGWKTRERSWPTKEIIDAVSGNTTTSKQNIKQTRRKC